MHVWRFQFLLLLVALLGAAGDAATEEDDEDSPYRSGLIATYRDENGHLATRVDDEAAIVDLKSTVDQRLVNNGLQAHWRGYLLTQADGEYRLAVHASGSVWIRLAGRVILESAADEPQWLLADPVNLEYAWHPLEIEYANEGARAQFALYWSGPNFQLEPVPSWSLFHDTGQTPPDHFERGARLARALRCDACHTDKPNRDQILAAPSLQEIRRSLEPSWLVEWLSAVPQQNDVSDEPTAHWPRRMPHFAISRQDALAISGYLFEQQPMREPAPVHDQASIDNGRQLFLSLGCLACHGLESFAEAELFGGGDLSQIAAKRRTGFFAQWLADPASLNARHRMPVFDLSDLERNELAAFLSSLGGPTSVALPSSEVELRHGQQLFRKLRCSACHESKIADADRRFVTAPQLSANSKWQDSCLSSPHSTNSRPGYGLSKTDRDALVEYYSKRTAPYSVTDGRQILQENNCLACHTRGQAAGLTGRLPAVIEAFPDLAGTLSAMMPPSLNSVGDKLHEHALDAAIRREEPPRRPWLKVRMPRFSLSEVERRFIIDQLTTADRIPDGHPDQFQPPSVSEPEEVTARLVTPDGFGCTSCHAVGNVKAPNAPLHTLGPNLLELGKRIRRQWFDRWVRNPARIVPRMEMPSVQTPVSGVLNDDVNLQLAAVWDVLNRPDFRPPDPSPVRIVRLSGDPQRHERAIVLTDVLQHGGRTYIKPLLVALPNRHNALFDLEHAAFSSWWVGDAAQQRTKGKTWYWEASDRPLFPAIIGKCDLNLILDGQALEPTRAGQFVTEFEEVRHVSDEWIQDAIAFSYRLTFGTHVVRVEQMVVPNPLGGMVRSIRLSGLPEGAVARLHVYDSEKMRPVRITTESKYSIKLPGQCTITLTTPTSSHIDSEHGTVEVESENGLAQIELAYECEEAIENAAHAAAEPRVHTPDVLEIVPGFEAVRLPTTDEIMPTGISWSPNGQLFITSLKGQVWRLIDSDSDGLEDQLQQASDELAAPYGLVAHNDYVDVINKYALLRLYDEDDDGFAERMVTLASGWGHTADYHDWAIGLLPDGAGGYYIALPCQQDERSEPAAHLRGSLLHAIPRDSANEGNQPFELRAISSGHRFPMGLAHSAQGDLFVTDNQGNYNPFNELNHVRPGAHFGFINALEREQKITVPPLTPPAINIPHPWTRSVNGICLLKTPPQINGKNQNLFGPFEGHVLGCEFDTKRLVRMSLEKIGETYQGAVYPLSMDQANEEGSQPQSTRSPSFIGPVVASISPRGDVYIGCLRDSGWGGANNIGGLVRLRPTPEQLPCGIAEVRAQKDGFQIHFTKPIDAVRASSPESYVISSYRRIPTSDYGGPDIERRVEKLANVYLSADGMAVSLTLNELRAGFVYEFHLRNLARRGSNDEAMFFPSEAHYTLNVVPN